MTSPTTLQLPVGTWTIDPLHSTVEFQARHLGIAVVKGYFQSFQGSLVVPEDGADATASGSIDVASLDTRVRQRDDHLRSPDFFDAARFPTIAFESTRIELGDDGLRVVGPLEIHGVRHDVVLQGELGGPAPSPWGERIAVALRTEISRRDFGMSFGWDPGPFPFVGDRVRIELDIEAVQEDQ